MLIDEIVRSGRCDQETLDAAMRSVFPYILRFSPVDTGDRVIDPLSIVLDNVDASLISSNTSIAIPQINMDILPNRLLCSMAEQCESRGLNVNTINISYSKTGQCVEPVSRNAIRISLMLFHILPQINPSMGNVRFWADKTYELASINFDTKTPDAFSNIYNILVELAKDVTSSEKLMLLCNIIYEVFNEYAVMKTLCLSYIAGWRHTADYVTILHNYLKSYTSTLRNLWYGEKDPNGMQLVLAFVYEHLLYDAMSSGGSDKINISPENRIQVILCRNSPSRYRVPESLQEITTRANLYVQRIRNGELDDKMLYHSAIFEESGNKGSASESNDCVTASYICGHLSDYLDELTPDDISFDIPEERLAMLTHDLGSKKFRVAFESANSDNLVHYYEDGEGTYKLFMAKDSARIVYGISTDPKRVELVRFSDEAPKYDYKFVHSVH